MKDLDLDIDRVYSESELEFGYSSFELNRIVFHCPLHGGDTLDKTDLKSLNFNHESNNSFSCLTCKTKFYYFGNSKGHKLFSNIQWQNHGTNATKGEL